MLRSFRSAMVLFIVAAAFLPVLVISVPFVAKIYSMTREGAVRELRLGAERAAADLQHELDFVHSRFVATGRDNDLVLAVSSPFFGFRGISLGNELLASSSLVQSVYLFDSRFDLVEALPEATASTRLDRLVHHLRERMGDGSRWRGRALWTLVDDPALVAAGLQRSGDSRMLVLAMPLYFEHYVQDRTDTQQGMFVALIPLQALQTMGLEHLRPYQKLMLRPEWIEPPTGSSDGWQSAAATLQVKDWLGMPLRLAVEVREPEQVRMQSVHDTLAMLFIFVAAAMALFSTLAFMLARRLGQPLLQIRQLANAYAAGNYQPAAAPVDFDEFRQIAQALAVMGQRIDDQLHALRASNAQLMQADKLKDDFLANTSHELRTPLHGIIGIASSLQERGSSELSPGVLQNLRLIEQSGRRLENLVNDILDISRIKNNALPLETGAVEIFSLVDVVVSLHSAQADQLGIRLVHAIPRTLPLVQADEFRLQQILHNLIGNALKFAGQSDIVLQAEAQGSTVRISVIDQGPGIAPDQLESLFEPFTRGSGALAQGPAGTGLGLAIARRLVEMQGGIMEVSSTPGMGSTFSFTLPVALQQEPDVPSVPGTPTTFDPDDFQRSLQPLAPQPQDGPAPVPQPAPAKPDGLAHVLIVDDEHINIQILANYFYDEPYVLHVARSGPEALEQLQVLEQVDLILLDVMMPKMSGFEVCCRIRANPCMDHVPILFLTARNQARDIHHGFHYGCNDYLVKPVSRIELLTRCQYHLQFARLKRELSLRRATEEDRVRDLTAELQHMVQQHSAAASQWRRLFDLSLELMPAMAHLALSTCVDRLAQLVPGAAIAVVHGTDIVSRLPLPQHSALHLAAREHHTWREPDWLRRNELVLQPIIAPQGRPVGELLLHPPAAVPVELRVRMASLLGSLLWRQRQYSELQRSVLEDGLTGTGNGKLLLRNLARLQRSFARYPDRHAVVFAVRIEPTAPVSESFSPEAADTLVLTTQRLLNSVLRQSDLLFRVEADLFAVMLEPCTFLQAIQIRARLMQRERLMRADFHSDEGRRIELPLSLSIALASTEYVPPDRLWQRALEGLLTQGGISVEAEEMAGPG